VCTTPFIARNVTKKQYILGLIIHFLLTYWKMYHKKEPFGHIKLSLSSFLKALEKCCIIGFTRNIEIIVL